MLVEKQRLGTKVVSKNNFSETKRSRPLSKDMQPLTKTRSCYTHLSKKKSNINFCCFCLIIRRFMKNIKKCLDIFPDSKWARECQFIWYLPCKAIPGHPPLLRCFWASCIWISQAPPKCHSLSKNSLDSARRSVEKWLCPKMGDLFGMMYWLIYC